MAKFQIPKLASDSRCQARMRLKGVETYCDQATNGTRCPAHAAKGLVQRRWANVRQAKDIAKSLAERVQEHGQASSPSLSLERRIAALNALLESLEAKAPLSLEDQKLIGHLDKTLAELVTLHLRLAGPGNDVVDAVMLHQRALELFDRLIPQEDLRQAVIEGFGVLLDELIQQQEVRESTTNVHQPVAQKATDKELHSDDTLC